MSRLFSGAVAFCFAAQLTRSSAALLTDTNSETPDVVVLAHAHNYVDNEVSTSSLKDSLMRREQQQSMATPPSYLQRQLPRPICPLMRDRHFTLGDRICPGSVPKLARDLQVACDEVDEYWNRVGSKNPWTAEFAHTELASLPVIHAFQKHDFYASGQEWLDLTLKTVQEKHAHTIIPTDIGTARALDFGCGLGRTVNSLARLGFNETLCVDASQPMMDAAKKELEALQGKGAIMPDLLNHISFVQSGIDLLCKVKPNSVDFVHSSMTLQYMKPFVQVAYIEQFCDLLKIGGSGVIQIASSVHGDVGDERCDLHHSRDEEQVPKRYHIEASEAVAHLTSRGCAVHGNIPSDTFGPGGHATLLAFKKSISMVSDDGDIHRGH